MKKIDFHIHSIFSDGVLGAGELCFRYAQKNFDAIVITDHCDQRNLEYVVSSLKQFADSWNSQSDRPIDVFVGVELTFVIPSLIPQLIEKSYSLGAQLVIVHGETIVEPVPKGTNLSAIEGGCDILAHPGFISDEEVKLAKEKGVVLEISTRKGHCYTNGWVLNMAKKNAAPVVVNNDSHLPSDILSYDEMKSVFLGAAGEDSFDLWSKGVSILYERLMARYKK